jgi:exopolyphosphatase/guanosine-5'-triphosphate,3'-diphosphate pyrophosphatase
MTRRFGAVDFGSNTVGFLVLERAGPTITIVERQSRFVRLSEGVAETASISPAAFDRGVAWTEEISRAMTRLGPHRLRAVGTEVLRRARNGAEFRAAVRPLLGVDLEVISGKEEGELTFSGVRLRYPDGPLAILDVGGGSTELVIGAGPEQGPWAVSLPIGVVSMTERFGEDHAAILQHAREWIREAGSGREPPPEPPQELTVLGGTGANLAMVDQGLRTLVDEKVEDHRVSRGRLDELLEIVAGSTLEQRIDLLGIPPRRADVIVAGIAILLAVLDELGLRFVRSTRYSLRHGVARTLMEW